MRRRQRHLQETTAEECRGKKNNSPDPYLAVQAQNEQHEEEQRRPEGSQGHQSHGLGVSDEGQAWTCGVETEAAPRLRTTAWTSPYHPTLTRWGCRRTPTALCHLADVHSLLCCHEAQNREDHEACKEAGSTVDESQDEGVPAERSDSDVSLTLQYICTS